jgi:hypothetical protein
VIKIFIKLLCVFSFSVLKAEIDFFPQDLYMSGDSPISVVVGDLNGDNFPDLAAANLLSNNIRLFINQGNGTFVGSGFIGSAAPTDLGISDIDMDGDLDLLASNAVNSTINVFKNNGDGTFLAMADIYLINPPGFPSVVKVQDLNKDNFPDLAIGMVNGNKVIVVFLNDGNGNFNSINSTPFINTIFSFGLGDFNGDDSPDLAMPSNFFSVIYLFDNDSFANFSFNNKTIVFNMNDVLPFSIETADLDGDQDLDLVTGLISAGTNSSIAIATNNGSGNFAITDNYFVQQPTVMNLSDLENDGDIDISVAHNNTNLISLLANIGNGTFTSPISFQVGNRPRSIKLSDVDQDGALDIITANLDDDTISVLRSRFLEISDIPDQLSYENQLAGPYPFKLTGGISNIVFRAKSSNTNLVSEANITFGGSGQNRTITLQPLSDQIGGTLITVTASNIVKGLTASDSFVLAVVNTNLPPSPVETNILETNVFFNTLAAHGYTLDVRKPRLGKRINFKTELGLKKFKARIITVNTVSNVSYALCSITNTIITNLDFVTASKLKTTKNRIFQRKGIKYKVTNRRIDPKTGKDLPKGTDFLNLVIKIEGIVQTNPTTVYLINTYKASVE